jgi:hypothetical protein
MIPPPFCCLGRKRQWTGFRQQGIGLLVQSLAKVDEAVFAVGAHGAPPDQFNDLLRQAEAPLNLARLALALDDEGVTLMRRFDEEASIALSALADDLNLYHALSAGDATARAATAKEIMDRLQTVQRAVKVMEQSCRDLLRTMEKPVEG